MANNKPITGVSYLLSGFNLISKPGIRKYVIIPFLINIAVFIGLFIAFSHFFDVFNHWIAHFLPAWLQWLSIIFWLFFIFSFAIFFIFAFVIFANIISAPFNNQLAAQVEFYLTGKILENQSLSENLKDLPRILKRQFSIIGFYLWRALLIGILFFVPLIHPFIAIIWAMLNAWFMTLQFIDYPSDNNRVNLPTVRTWLYENNLLTLGFGISVLAVTMVPILNFFAIPAAVAGATKLWVEEYK